MCEGIDLAAPPDRPLRVALASDPIDVRDVFMYHKTTRRDVYERARASQPPVAALRRATGLWLINSVRGWMKGSLLP